MKKFADLLRREQGLTLVELITAIALFAMVSALVYAVMSFGLRSYHAITAENKIRDEADLLMSAVITEMYTFAPETVSQTPDGILLKRSSSASGNNEETIEIRDGKLSIRSASPSSADIRTDITATLAADSEISLKCSTTTACSSGLLNIQLHLVSATGGKDFNLSLNSTFGF